MAMISTHGNNAEQGITEVTRSNLEGGFHDVPHRGAIPRDSVESIRKRAEVALLLFLLGWLAAGVRAIGGWSFFNILIKRYIIWGDGRGGVL